MPILNFRSYPPAFLSLCLVSSAALPAQTTAKPPVRRSTATTSAHKPAVAAKPASACVEVPQLSEKIPAVPASAGCVKSLYALEFKASHLDPQLSATLRTSLEALNQSFSLNYIDTKVGTGELALPKKYYTVNYTGYLVDGTKFDSSLEAGREPFVFPYGAHRVVQGWDTGFEGMRAGGKRRLFVPYQLGYGEQGKPGSIPPKAMLIFDVEFLSQSDTPPAPKAPPAPPAGATPPAGTDAPATPPAGSGAAPATSTPPPADGSKPTAPAATPPPSL